MKSANITSYSHTQIVLLVEEWQSEAYGVPSYQRCEYLGATAHRVKIRLETGQVSPVSKWERVGNAHVQCINSKREIGHFVDIELNHYELSGYRLFGSGDRSFLDRGKLSGSRVGALF